MARGRGPKPGLPVPKPRHRVEHGTERGYQWHLRHKDPMCDLCQRGHKEYTDGYRLRKRKQKAVLQSMLSGGRGSLKITDAEYREIMKTIKEDLGELGLCE